MTAPAKLRLLAVDDNRLILRVIADFFTPRGFTVVTAEGVAEAREAIDERLPDVIVSDILMPEIDGWEFFDGVRRDPRTAAIPFVFLTVEGELPQRLRGLHLGADDYLTKPFAVEELHARLVKLVERRRGGGTADALLAGSVEHLAISDLLQILSLNGKDGLVQLSEGDLSGLIAFDRGRIVHAETGSCRGTKALFRMLGWTAARFRVLPRPASFTDASITAPTAGILMDGLVALDEWVRFKELLPEDGTRLALAADARARLSGQGVNPVEFDVLARARIGATVAETIAESPHPDAQVAEAICTLLGRGVLEVDRGASLAG
ncbi:MAG TPA: response regulator [Candidatus Polarisedimenticolaceae bacterium]|nr:response regulator [Candidatus Polarisedimenticolaceae bacterium]